MDLRGGTGRHGPLASKDELNMIKHESQEHEFLHGSSHKGNHHHHGHDLSHIGHDLGEHNYIAHNGHGLSHGGQQTPSHH